MIRPALAETLPGGQIPGQVGKRFRDHVGAAGSALKPQQDFDVVGVAEREDGAAA